MLIHVLVVVDPPSERKRLIRLLQQPDVVLTGVPGKTNLLERLSRETFDLLVVDRAAFSTPGRPLDPLYPLTSRNIRNSW